MLELTEVQIALIGIVALVIVQALRLWKATTGTDFGQVTLTWVLFVVSVVLAYFFILPVLPGFPAVGGDPSVVVGGWMAWISALVIASSGVLGFATVIYALLAKLVFEKLVTTTLRKNAFKLRGK